MAAPRASRALIRRAFADARVRTFSFAFFFFVMAYIQPTGYRSSFPTLRERLVFANSFGDNKAIRLFYGTPHDLLTVGGYCAWRVLGVMSIFAGVWGLLAAVRALRAEEESGRAELVLASAVTRGLFLRTALAAIAAGAAILWLALFLGLTAGKLPAGGAAYLALATVSPIPVFAGVGALASQLAPTRRLAIELSSGVLAIMLLLRIAADTAGSVAWLRWATPLGWAEEMRAFAGPRPAVLLLPLGASIATLIGATMIALRREIGRGLLSPRDTRAPKLRLLTSTTAHALRSEIGTLVAWLVGIGGFALVMGVISHSFSSADISTRLQREVQKLGGASITTPAGALSLYFLFFVAAISFFVCSQLAAVRREESDDRLETLFALPVGRRSWLIGRLGLAFAGATLLALGAGVLAWAGAASQGGGVSFADMLGAGANCLPAALLFLGLGALAFAATPRATVAVAYALVSVAFVWELVGAFIDVPDWTLSLSPFHEIGLVPDQPFKATAALIMLAIAAVSTALALVLFRRRDLTGA